MTLDTVFTETPARAATSLSLVAIRSPSTRLLPECATAIRGEVFTGDIKR
jgi:hypothetical protein